MSVKISKKKVLLPIILTIIYFIMLASYWNQPLFTSDEGEIFLNGHAIAHGRLLYQEASSQHMPLMYYIAAFFNCFGASTVVEYRLCFYALMAVLWGIMYYRYSANFGRVTMIMYPILYIIFLNYIYMGSTILSEQIQGIGMVILLLEFLLFEKTRKLEKSNMIFISISIFLSFGSAFVSVFAIFYILMAVVALEISKCIKGKIGFLIGLKNAFLFYWKLVVIVIIPFLLLALYYIFNGTFDDFYGWVYLINREVYPKYLGGYGNSVISGLLGGINNILTWVKTDNISNNIVYCIAIIGSVYCIVSIQKKRRNFILTLGVALFLVGCSTRGLFQNFHGLPAVAVLCIMDAYALKELCKYYINNAAKIAFVVFMMMAFSSTYVEMFFNAFSKNSIINNRPASHPYTHIINLLTEDNEIVGINTFDTQAIFESRALPSYTNAACAWIWEWGGEQMMEEYNKIFPKLIIYDPGYVVWSHPIIEYAADLHSFIEKNYTSMEALGAPTLYVRNDFYQEAYDIVDNYHEH